MWEVAVKGRRLGQVSWLAARSRAPRRAETCVGSAPAFPETGLEWPRASSPTAGRLQLRAQLRHEDASVRTGFPFHPARVRART